MTSWSEPAEFTVDSSVRDHHSGIKRWSTFRLAVRDEYSGLPILEFELSADDFMRMLSGTLWMKTQGELAVPDLLERLNHHRHEFAVPLPKALADIREYSKPLQESVAAGILEWYEDQPGSAQMDGARVQWDGSKPKLWVWKWYTKAEWEAELAKNEEADE